MRPAMWHRAGTGPRLCGRYAWPLFCLKEELIHSSSFGLLLEQRSAETERGSAVQIVAEVGSRSRTFSDHFCMLSWLTRTSIPPVVHRLPLRPHFVVKRLWQQGRVSRLYSGHIPYHAGVNRLPYCAARRPAHLSWCSVTASRSNHAAAVAPSRAVEVQKSLSDQAPRGLRWRKVKQWVVFSDLHLSHKTLETVLKVLARVHQEACQRDAGILFLGECL